VALFVLFHQSRDGPVHQSIGPWAYGRAGPNRKARLVPLIAITAAMTTGINEWQSFQSNRLDHNFVATPYLLGLVSLSVTPHVLVGQITNLGKRIPHVKRPNLCHLSSKPALRTSSAVVNPQPVCFLDEKSEESVRFKIFLNPNELSCGLKTLDPIFVLALLQSLPDTLLETVSHNPLRHVLPLLRPHGARRNVGTNAKHFPQYVAFDGRIRP
jgi:hypothetical protein